MATKRNPAVQAANQALAPVLAEIRRQQAEEQRRAAAQQQAARDRAGGLAGVLEGIAPQTQATYKVAGDSTAAFAKGFAVAAAGDSNAAKAELDSILARTGQGQTVRAAGENGGDVLYGLGGFIPASGLAREGAAFTAAAQNLPATARLQGESQVGQLALQSRDKMSELNALLRGEKAKLPGLVQEFGAQQADSARKDRAERLNELIAVENLGIRKDQLGISKENAVTSRMSVQLRASQQKFNQILAKAKLDLDQDQFGLALQREQRMSKPKKKGGFTDAQRQELQQTALDTARDDFKGAKYDEKGNFAGYDPTERRAPVETLRDLIGGGVPFSLAIKAIQRFAKGSKPADMSAQTWALWRATLKWTKK